MFIYMTMFALTNHMVHFEYTTILRLIAELCGFYVKFMDNIMMLKAVFTY